MTGTTEERILGYGQRAVGQGTRVAQAPTKQGGGKPAPVAPHVARARTVWAAHFAHEPGRAKVVIHALVDAPSTLIAKSDFDAWTNSATAIYVHPDAATSNATLLAVLHHENVHVGQFLRDKVRWPRDHAAMMRYECEAYGESATWSAAHPDPDVRAFVSRSATIRDLFCKEISRVESDTSIPTESRNAVYRKFFLDNKMLPGHTRIEELYRP